jgi:hypothetical protein
VLNLLLATVACDLYDGSMLVGVVLYQFRNESSPFCTQLFHLAPSIFFGQRLVQRIYTDRVLSYAATVAILAYLYDPESFHDWFRARGLLVDVGSASSSHVKDVGTQTSNAIPILVERKDAGTRTSIATRTPVETVDEGIQTIIVSPPPIQTNNTGTQTIIATTTRVGTNDSETQTTLVTRPLVESKDAGTQMMIATPKPGDMQDFSTPMTISVSASTPTGDNATERNVARYTASDIIAEADDSLYSGSSRSNMSLSKPEAQDEHEFGIPKEDDIVRTGRFAQHDASSLGSEQLNDDSSSLCGSRIDWKGNCSELDIRDLDDMNKGNPHWKCPSNQFLREKYHEFLIRQATGLSYDDAIKVKKEKLLELARLKRHPDRFMRNGDDEKLNPQDYWHARTFVWGSDECDMWVEDESADQAKIEWTERQEIHVTLYIDGTYRCDAKMVQVKVRNDAPGQDYFHDCKEVISAKKALREYQDELCAEDVSGPCLESKVTNWACPQSYLTIIDPSVDELSPTNRYPTNRQPQRTSIAIRPPPGLENVARGTFAPLPITRYYTCDPPAEAGSSERPACRHSQVSSDEATMQVPREISFDEGYTTRSHTPPDVKQTGEVTANDKSGCTVEGMATIYRTEELTDRSPAELRQSRRPVLHDFMQAKFGSNGENSGFGHNGRKNYRQIALGRNCNLGRVGKPGGKDNQEPELVSDEVEARFARLARFRRRAPTPSH